MYELKILGRNPNFGEEEDRVILQIYDHALENNSVNYLGITDDMRIIDQLLEFWSKLNIPDFCFYIMGSCANNGVDPFLININFEVQNELYLIIFACKKSEDLRAYAHINRVATELGLFD